MKYTIVWTNEAIATFEDRITYLKINWTQREIINFKARVKEYLAVLIEAPQIGKKPGRLKDVHMGLILKQASIIYRVKHLTKELN